MKLVKKERIGARIKKKYEKPKTPYQRVMDCPVDAVNAAEKAAEDAARAAQEAVDFLNGSEAPRTRPVDNSVPVPFYSLTLDADIVMLRGLVAQNEVSTVGQKRCSKLGNGWRLPKSGELAFVKSDGFFSNKNPDYARVARFKRFWIDYKYLAAYYSTEDSKESAYINDVTRALYPLLCIRARHLE